MLSWSGLVGCKYKEILHDSHGEIVVFYVHKTSEA